MDSWWRLGEGFGYSGEDLAVYQITCPFCMERGNLETEFHAEKKKPNSDKKLNFDALKCGNLSLVAEFPTVRRLFCPASPRMPRAPDVSPCAERAGGIKSPNPGAMAQLYKAR